MFEKTEFGMAANHYISSLYYVASTKGLDVDTILQQVGLEHSVLNKADIRVSTQKLADFQRIVWDLLGDESMGLNAECLKRGSYYMMGYVSVYQPTLRKALEMGMRFFNLITHRHFVTLSMAGDETKIAFCLKQPELDYKHMFAELTLLAWHRYSSWLIADSLPLVKTCFNYAEPNHSLEYNYLFPGVHQFESSQLALVFPSQYLDRPVKQNEQSLRAFINNCPVELFRRYKADYSLSSDVRREISKDLHDGSVTIEDVADKLHMTVRTLMRRLKDEGTSFQQLKDIIRRDKAILYLQQNALSIGTIAEKIGFSDPAVFTRAFKKWTGECPKNYRQKHHAES